MKYITYMSARDLQTPKSVMEYPAYWELMKWYKCWRKIPYPSEVIAAIIAEERSEEYRHYPCPLYPHHWHIGRGGGLADKRKLTQRAKRSYRKAVRDEIWAEHEEKLRVVREEENKDV